jgi:hypothetical protein
MGDVHPVETIRGLAEVSDADKTSILGRTAQAFFKIRVAWSISGLGRIPYQP